LPPAAARPPDWQTDLRFRTQTFANLQLTTLLNAALRRVLGEVTFIQVVRDEPYQKVAKDSAQK
jgi:hypothetical protein